MEITKKVNNFSLTKIKLECYLTRKTLESNRLAQNIFFPEWDITLQRQIGVGSTSTQTQYFWRKVLIGKWQKAQISSFPPFSC